MYSIINKQDFLDEEKVVKHFKSYLEILAINGYSSDENRRLYKNFWAMNAAVNLPKTDFDDIYFNRILGEKIGKLEDIINITNPEKDTRLGFQLSFATKAAHIIDTDLPIYDVMIKDFYFLKSITSINDWGNKMIEARKQYDFLIKEYQRIIDKDLLKPTIDKIDNILKNNNFDENMITTVKKIDSIIWCWTTYLKKGAILNESLQWI